MKNYTTFLESTTETEVNDVELFESTFVQELTGKKWKVKIIQGDTQGSSAFYPKALLESSPNVVKEGTRIYLDHKGEMERPERSVSRLAGVFASDSYYEDGALFAEAEIFSDYIDWVKERAKAGVVGLSIHGAGSTYEENGKKIAESIDAVHSVDIVTTAGAGGAFMEIVESQSQKEEIMELPKELLEALDTQANALNELVEAQKKQAAKFDELLESQKEQEQEQEVEEAKVTAADVSEALVEAGLTKQGRASVYAAVEAGTELEEAITAEKEREQEILTESNARFGAGNEGTKETKTASQLIFG